MRRARVLAEISVVHQFPFPPILPHPLKFTCIQPCRVRAGRRYCARKRDQWCLRTRSRASQFIISFILVTPRAVRRAALVILGVHWSWPPIILPSPRNPHRSLHTIRLPPAAVTYIRRALVIYRPRFMMI